MDWKYESGRIYSVDENNDLLAETTFSFKGDGEVDIEHTFVDSSLRGRGVAGEMLETVARYLREHGLKAVASCSYANAWLKKNRGSYSDIISKDLDDHHPSCRIDGKH